tara:strand:+ start:2612 stop:3541 length:930 start_codon:yes stop_codon:yes gene_type:complete
MIEPEQVQGSDFLIELPTPTTNAAQQPRPQPVQPAQIPQIPQTPEKMEKIPEIPPTPEKGSAAKMIDDKGTEYDPTRHIPTKHPKYGFWMPRKIGKKGRVAKPIETETPAAQNLNSIPEQSDVQKSAPTNAAESQQSQIPESGSFVHLPYSAGQQEQGSGPTVKLDSKQTAQTLTAILHVVSMKVFGAADGKFTADEVETLNEAGAHVMDKRQIQLSPEWALVAAVATVFGMRLTTPRGLTLTEKFTEKLTDWWTYRKARAAGRYVKKTQRKADQQHEKQEREHRERDEKRKPETGSTSNAERSNPDSN